MQIYVGDTPLIIEITMWRIFSIHERGVYHSLCYEIAYDFDGVTRNGFCDEKEHQILI